MRVTVCERKYERENICQGVRNVERGKKGEKQNIEYNPLLKADFVGVKYVFNNGRPKIL